jgi:hypothetical protein
VFIACNRVVMQYGTENVFVVRYEQNEQRVLHNSTRIISLFIVGADPKRQIISFERIFVSYRNLSKTRAKFELYFVFIKLERIPCVTVYNLITIGITYLYFYMSRVVSGTK